MCVLLAPSAIHAAPAAWLRAISHYRAEMPRRPDFAYRSVRRAHARRPDGRRRPVLWKIGLNGVRADPRRHDREVHRDVLALGFDAARDQSGLRHGRGDADRLDEPGRARAMTRARSAAMRSRPVRSRGASGADDAQVLVGCGCPIPDFKARDRRSGRRCGGCTADTVGELWIAGPHVAGAYWDNPAATAEALGAASRARRRMAAQRRSRVSRFDRAIVHHRTDQGSRDHPRDEPLSAGHRIHRADLPSGAAVECRRRVCGGGRRWGSSGW